MKVLRDNLGNDWQEACATLVTLYLSIKMLRDIFEITGRRLMLHRELETRG